MVRLYALPLNETYSSEGGYPYISTTKYNGLLLSNIIDRAEEKVIHGDDNLSYNRFRRLGVCCAKPTRTAIRILI